ncbi:MAG: methionine--tRNA ligase [Bacilli bacterium]|nr:methionine--tRNA ligase [Bacilli bacterium]
MKNILIGISWPFANGDLHIGHAASSLPGDVIARYHRLKGNNVILVSGSDCHGTPIDVKALQENKSAKEIVDLCHENFTRDWKNLGVSFDLYNRTDDEYHKNFVKKQFKKYYEYGYLYEQQEEQLFCSHCNLFLADRYIVGVCPKCGSNIKGDECEKCGSLLEIKDVKETKCAICGNKTSIKETKNLYFSLSRFQDNIKDLVSKNKLSWRENAILFTERYIKEGIPDRCASRSLNWGIDIPIKDYEDKKIYGWFENVWGYVTASKKYCEEHNLNWEDFWKNDKDNKIYLVHAKDNIPFHTVIFPSLLLATKDNYKLPDKIISDEYITIESEKLSKSKGNYISVKDILERYPADAVRYYFLYNDPEKRDFNFTWNDFINSINGELLGKWGNFINRTLVFIKKSFDGKLTNSKIDIDVEYKLKRLFETVGEDIDNGNVKDGLIKIFDFISYANKYFDEKEPWKLAKENIEECNNVLLNCVNIILNVNTLLKPYLPFSCETVEGYLNEKVNNWEYVQINNVEISKEIKPLYERYDKSRIEEEKERLKNTI